MAIEHQHALPQGFRLDGYRIERVLGSGGFGVTYLAEQVAIERKVAIKEYLPAGLATRHRGEITIHPISARDREDYEYGLARFRDEAKTLVAFEHPNIVTVHDYIEANGTAYLVMQYVEGEDLEVILRRARTLTESELREILYPLLDGLEQVHAAGFLHRDIKPANIFIRADGAPVLLDFGAARQALGEKSQSITTIFTPGYAPFEQYASRQKQGPWTDIYSLGATLYRAVTGNRPPDAPDRVGADDLLEPTASRAKGKYGKGFLRAIDTALAREPSDRPQDIAQWRAMFGPSQPAAAPPKETGMAPGRRGWVLAAAILAVLIVVSGGYWGWGAYRESEQLRIAADEARAKAAEEARREAAEEAKRKAAEEVRLKAAEEARAKAAEEARRKAADEAERKAAEAARRKAAEEAERKAAEAARRKAAEAAKRKAAEAAKRKAAEEAERKAAEAARRKAAEAARLKAVEEARRRAAEEARRRAAEEARRPRLPGYPPPPGRPPPPPPGAGAQPRALSGPDIRRLISGRAVGIVRPTRRGGGTLTIWFSFRGDGTFQRRCSVRRRFGGMRGCRRPSSFGRWWLRENRLCFGRRGSCFTIHRLPGGYTAQKRSGGRSAFAGPITVQASAPR